MRPYLEETFEKIIFSLGTTFSEILGISPEVGMIIITILCVFWTLFLYRKISQYKFLGLLSAFIALFTFLVGLPFIIGAYLEGETLPMWFYGCFIYWIIHTSIVLMAMYKNGGLNTFIKDFLR